MNQIEYEFIIDESHYFVPSLLVKAFSRTIQKNNQNDQYTIYEFENLRDPYGMFSMIIDLFYGRTIEIDEQNSFFLGFIADTLGITELSEATNSYRQIELTTDNIFRILILLDAYHITDLRVMQYVGDNWPTLSKSENTTQLSFYILNEIFLSNPQISADFNFVLKIIDINTSNFDDRKSDDEYETSILKNEFISLFKYCDFFKLSESEVNQLLDFVSFDSISPEILQKFGSLLLFSQKGQINDQNELNSASFKSIKPKSQSAFLCSKRSKNSIETQQKAAESNRQKNSNKPFKSIKSQQQQKTEENESVVWQPNPSEEPITFHQNKQKSTTNASTKNNSNYQQNLPTKTTEIGQQNSSEEPITFHQNKQKSTTNTSTKNNSNKQQQQQQQKDEDEITSQNLIEFKPKSFTQKQSNAPHQTIQNQPHSNQQEQTTQIEITYPSSGVAGSRKGKPSPDLPQRLTFSEISYETGFELRGVVTAFQDSPTLKNGQWKKEVTLIVPEGKKSVFKYSIFDHTSHSWWDNFDGSSCPIENAWIIVGFPNYTLRLTYYTLASKDEKINFSQPMSWKIIGSDNPNSFNEDDDLIEYVRSCPAMNIPKPMKTFKIQKKAKPYSFFKFVMLKNFSSKYKCRGEFNISGLELFGILTAK